MTYKKWYWTWEESINGTNTISIDEIKDIYLESEAYMTDSFAEYMNESTGKNGALDPLEDGLKYLHECLNDAIEMEDYDLYEAVLEEVKDVLEKINENKEA